MPQLARALAVALASLMLFSAAPPAEAAKKKATRPAAAQTRQATKPKARPRARPAAAAARQAAAAPATKATQLERLYDEYWDASMRLNPLQATFQGDARYNGELPNILSAAWRQQSHDFTTQWLARWKRSAAAACRGRIC